MDAGQPSGLFVGDVTPDRADRKREYLAGYQWYNYTTGTYSNLANHAGEVSRFFGDRLYDAMLLDATVRSTINTLKASILADGLQLQPPVTQDDPFGLGESDPLSDAEVELAEEICDAAEEMDRRMDEPIEESCWQLLDGIPYGSMLAENTATYRDWRGQTKLFYTSMHVKPRWVWYFLMDRAGTVRGFTGAINRRPGDQITVLPRDKFTLFSWFPKARDPRGTPALDAVYDPWNMRVLMRPQEWKYISRFAVPSYFGTTAEGAADVEMPDGTRKTAQEAFLDAILALENATGCVGAFGATLRTLDPQGDGSVFRVFEEKYRHEIVFGILQQTQATLEAQHSSKASSETSQDIMALLTRVAKKYLSGVLYRDRYRPWVSWNWGPDKVHLTPVPMLGMNDQADFSRNANAIARLAQTGMIPPNAILPILTWLGLGGIVKKLPPMPPPVAPAPAPGQAPNNGRPAPTPARP